MFARLRAGVSNMGSRAASLAKRAYDALPSGTTIRNAIPGTAIVIARGGSAIFNGFKFVTNVTGITKITKGPVGVFFAALVLGLVLGCSAIRITIKTRFWNLFRKESNAANQKAEDDTDDINVEELEAQIAALEAELAKNQELQAFLEKLKNESEEEPENTPVLGDATWTRPGIRATKKQQTAYIITQLQALLYVTGSGLSGVLSLNSLTTLLGMLTLNEWQYNDECKSDDPQSRTFTILVVFVAMAILIHSNIASFLKYNLPNLRNYFRALFMDEHHDGGWRSISKFNYFKVTFSSLLGSLGLFYSNFHLFKVLQDNILCHATDVNFSEGFVKSASYLFAINNLFITILMTLGAIHNRHRNQLEERTRQAELAEMRKLLAEGADKNAPEPIEMKEYRRPEPKKEPKLKHFASGTKDIDLKLGVAGNTLSTALSVYNAVVTLPHTVGGADLARHPGMIVAGIGLGLFGGDSQYYLDLAGIQFENEAAKKEADNKVKETEMKEMKTEQKPAPELKEYKRQEKPDHIALDIKDESSIPAPLEIKTPASASQQPAPAATPRARTQSYSIFATSNRFAALSDMGEQKSRGRSVSDTVRFYQKKRQKVPSENNLALLDVACLGRPQKF